MGRGRRGGGHDDKESGPKNAKKHSNVDEQLIETTKTETPVETTYGPSRKRQKREEYRASIQQEKEQAEEGTAEFHFPKKKWFRQRAHANPFSDHRLAYPIGPQHMDWSIHFPDFVKPADESQDTQKRSSNDEEAQGTDHPVLTTNVEVADIGCGFGGLLFAYAPMYPDTLMLGMEIRTSVTEFVENKIRALRQQQRSAPNTVQKEQLPNLDVDATDTAKKIPGGYKNISVVRTNSMKFLPNFFPKASLRTIFLCFPDPHFKSRKHKARIVSSTLNSEYAYVLREGGHVATITDVEELSLWIAEKFDKHKSFERVVVDEADPGNDGVETGNKEANALAKLMRESTEEGRKVDRFGGKKFVGIWRRLKDPPWPEQ